ncbi:MAG: recombination-associated protein RdgC [Candidatus Competibacteraceae bacterium]
MWFRNLTLFRFAEPFTLTAERLAGKLAQAIFQPCTTQMMISHGWVPPLGRRATDLVHATGGCLLICLKSEEKLLPAGIIKEMVVDRVATLEERENRRVRRPEREQLCTDVLQELLPRALSRSQLNYAYIDTRQGWLIVDSINRKVVDRLTHSLRAVLGSLPITPPPVANVPAIVMTAWLADNLLDADFTLADECELQDRDEGGGVVRCKGQDLNSSEILAHLQAGMQVTRVALVWKQRLAFVLTEDLSIRRLRFLDVIKEQVGETDTLEQLFDAEFALMTGELAEFLPRLWASFGVPLKAGVATRL